jgi:hypothetical protein
LRLLRDGVSGCFLELARQDTRRHPERARQPFIGGSSFSIASGSLPRIERSLDYATQALFQGIFIGAGSILLYSKAVTTLGMMVGHLHKGAI